MKRDIDLIVSIDGQNLAQLSCGHQVPFSKSTDSTEDCRACQRFEIPSHFVPYKRTPEFDENTVPAGLLRDHNTKRGVWGTIVILEGQLRYSVSEPEVETILSADKHGVVQPEVLHFIEPIGAVRFYVEFYRAP